ncbi:hypothetical protein [Sulfitobacter sabulilitoris]|uniref:Uncharacterized protein n=1 Tax=Sulfitobacter sabulilitoris TaxID=2562655 RepID=A0A5S3PD49_9RHOB|nr:hypothetical protein [Sulfitobacter sabulilitoris]TMM51688.1 hypothetical protein FDT80_13095 [Sulfitobacter sabulilitoris]
MNEISIGAVGAAAIAGLVSMLGLIIGKEQKVSEFRQVWIDQLRKCVVDYLVSINAVCDILSLRKSGEEADNSALLTNYKLLNEASHGITLRVNDTEKPAKALLTSMNEFEKLAQDNNSLTPEKIKEVEGRFVLAAKELLKFEWTRVKRGESVFVWTKRVILLGIVFLLGLLGLFWYDGLGNSPLDSEGDSQLHLVLKAD